MSEWLMLDEELTRGTFRLSLPQGRDNGLEGRPPRTPEG
jgi:hypothetical protein